MLWLIQRQLKSKNTASRRKAVERLCDAPHPRALGALRGALTDEDAEVRRLAATALGKLEIEERIEPLLKTLAPKDGYLFLDRAIDLISAGRGQIEKRIRLSVCAEACS